MRQRLFFLCVIFSVLLASFGVGAEEEAKEEPKLTIIDEAKPQGASSVPLEEKKISLSLRNIDIAEALKFFSMKTGMNIIPTQKVSGRVTLSVEQAPMKDVFDIMLRSNSLAYDKKGDIYNVMTEDEYRRLYGKSFSDIRQVKVFRLKYAVPEQAFTMLDTIKSTIGRLLVEPESGTVLVLDTAENIQAAEKALQSLEQETTVKVFNLKYAKAKDVEEQLKAQLDVKKVGSIKSDERTNQVIVQTLPERMKNIETLIASLDQKTKAVLIDTKIIQITLSNALSSGIEWEGLFELASNSMGLSYLGSYPFSAVQSASAAWRSRPQVVSDMKGNIGSYPFSGTTSNVSGGTKVSPGEKMHIGIIGEKRDFDILIKYLQTLGKTKIISNPTLSVINNQEAKIHVGQRQAYVTTTTTSGASTTTTSEDVTFVDVGVRLSIIPMINDDGYVTMKVRPEISSVIGQLPTSSNNVIPIIDTSMAETTVIAKDGSTIVIGGLGKEEKLENTEQVPILGKIPVLGFLFRSKTQSTVRTELLIILTPYIVEGDRLITGKDRESELFGIKPMKKFDVFKEEIPESVPAAGGMAPGVLVPKVFKGYPLGPLSEGNLEGRNTLASLSQEATATAAISKKEKAPSQEGIKDSVFSEDKENLDKPGPKGYRAYN
jgi:type II secretory pathway component GspD/PulD (secretin)